MVIVMNGTIRYTIRPYDTIWMLAQVFNTTVDDIMQLNPGIEPRNLLIGQVVNIRPGYHYPTYTEDSGMNTGGEDMMDQSMDDLDNLFRMLWQQHETWTMMAVIGLVQGLPQADLILQRLLRNPVDFANALEPFYGVEVAQAFSDLLTAHLTIAAEVVRAAMSGDNNALTDADERWYANADEIAALLGRINPYWAEDDWDAMLHEHLDLLSTFVSDMIAGKYAEAIAQFDVMEAQALEMADMMAYGVTEQFPG
jgi:hypothetical protein